MNGRGGLSSATVNATWFEIDLVVEIAYSGEAEEEIFYHRQPFLEVIAANSGFLGNFLVEVGVEIFPCFYFGQELARR